MIGALNVSCDNRAKQYALYNGFWARDLMPCLCRDFWDFTKVCHVFVVIFYCP